MRSNGVCEGQALAGSFGSGSFFMFKMVKYLRLKTALVPVLATHSCVCSSGSTALLTPRMNTHICRLESYARPPNRMFASI